MSAPASLAAAFAIAAPLILLSVPASAADLFEPPRGAAGYGDSRYGDAYGPLPDERRYGEAYEEEDRSDDRYAGHPEDFGPPFRPRAAINDQDFYPPYDRRYGEACVPRYVARDRLHAAGWYEFRDLEPRGELLYAEARSRSGRLFELTINRCSGEIVDARALDLGRDYAYGGYGGRRYWPRPY
jgi:hypothetical protein